MERRQSVRLHLRDYRAVYCPVPVKALGCIPRSGESRRHAVGDDRRIELNTAHVLVSRRARSRTGSARAAASELLDDFHHLP